MGQIKLWCDGLVCILQRAFPSFCAGFAANRSSLVQEPSPTFLSQLYCWFPWALPSSWRRELLVWAVQPKGKMPSACPGLSQGCSPSSKLPAWCPWPWGAPAPRTALAAGTIPPRSLAAGALMCSLTRTDELETSLQKPKDRARSKPGREETSPRAAFDCAALGFASGSGARWPQWGWHPPGLERAPGGCEAGQCSAG